MLGIALGVAALIIVLSVMNGFPERGARPHAQRGLAHRDLCARRRRCPTDGAARWREARATRRWWAAAPFVAAQALLARGEDMKGRHGARHRPGAGTEVTDLVPPTRCSAQLVPGEFRIMLGGELARSWACAGRPPSR